VYIYKNKNPLEKYSPAGVAPTPFTGSIALRPICFGRHRPTISSHILRRSIRFIPLVAYLICVIYLILKLKN